MISNEYPMCYNKHFPCRWIQYVENHFTQAHGTTCRGLSASQASAYSNTVEEFHVDVGDDLVLLLEECCGLWWSTARTALFPPLFSLLVFLLFVALLFVALLFVFLLFVSFLLLLWAFWKAAADTPLPKFWLAGLQVEWSDNYISQDSCFRWNNPVRKVLHE